MHEASIKTLRRAFKAEQFQKGKDAIQRRKADWQRWAASPRLSLGRADEDKPVKGEPNSVASLVPCALEIMRRTDPENVTVRWYFLFVEQNLHLIEYTTPVGNKNPSIAEVQWLVQNGELKT
jgi:hypothetical protein